MSILYGRKLDFLYYQKYYKPISIGLSRQTKAAIPQQMIFVTKLEEDGGATLFSSLKQQLFLKLFFRLFNCNRII